MATTEVGAPESGRRTAAVLQTRDLSKRFGDLRAVAGISFAIGEGET
jgi:ABC-type branched-subunit amino acid transport system ATPase component